jgi:hypothetical protein
MKRFIEDDMNAGQQWISLICLSGLLTGAAGAPVWGDSISFNVVIMKTVAHTPENPQQVNWTSVTLPNGFVVASSYLQLTSSFSVAHGGIQIYTDNTAADAGDYRYLGTISSTTVPPSGLVDRTTGRSRLPLAWTIQTGTTAPAPQNPNTPAGYLWFYMLDRGQVAVPSQGVTAFEDGIPYMTVVNNQCPGLNGWVCIHYAQGGGGQNDFTQFGEAVQPHNIFLQADFSSAVTPRTYGTQTLRLEAFSQ